MPAPKKAARAAEAGKDFDFQVYYLTLDGHAPSPKSLGQVSMAHISCISFGQDILRWLNSCSWSTKNTPDLDSILRQYSRLLKKLTGYGGGDVYMDRITELVGSCRENYESAVAVAGVLARVREKKIQTVFDKIQDSFAKCGLQSEELRDKNREFSRFCAIRANEKYRVELWFQASVYEGYALVYGVVLRKIVDGKPQVVSSSCELAEFEEVFACPGWRAKVREQVDDFAAWQKKGCWWIWERNILGEGDPLYLDPTDLDADLFDPGYFADVLARIQKELDEQLPHILDTGVWA